MAKKSAIKQSYDDLVKTIVSFVDASRRLKIAVERTSFSFTRTPVEGVDWAFLHGFLKDDIVESLVAIEIAVNALRDQMAVGQSSFPPDWAKPVDSVWRIGKWACDDARTAGWFEGKFVETNIRGRHELEKLNFATTLAEAVLDEIKASTIPVTQRSILQSLLESGRQKADQLMGSACGKKANDGHFRRELSSLVTDGLITAGSGRKSLGYSLTDRGTRIASIVRTFGEFLN